MLYFNYEQRIQLVPLYVGSNVAIADLRVLPVLRSDVLGYLPLGLERVHSDEGPGLAVTLK